MPSSPTRTSSLKGELTVPHELGAVEYRLPSVLANDADDNSVFTTACLVDHRRRSSSVTTEGIRSYLRQRRRSSVLSSSDAGLSANASWRSCTTTTVSEASSPHHHHHHHKFSLPTLDDCEELISECTSDIDHSEGYEHLHLLDEHPDLEESEGDQQVLQTHPDTTSTTTTTTTNPDVFPILKDERHQTIPKDPLALECAQEGAPQELAAKTTAIVEDNYKHDTAHCDTDTQLREECASTLPHSDKLIRGFDEHGLSPIVTHFEPPAEPHKFESAIMFFLRYACGGSNWGVVTVAATLVVGVPLLSHFTATSMLVICLALCVLGFTKYVVGNAIFWYNHMRPQEEELDPDAKRKPFLARRVGQRPHKQRDGKKVWYPILTDEESKTRAFAPYGISLACYFHDLFTWALEYKVRGVCRAICCDFNIGEYSSTKATHEDIYNFIINSSMACFIDADDEGKLKTFESKIAHPDGRTIEVYKLVSELDHQNQRHIRTIIQWEKAEEGCPAHVTVLTDSTEAIYFIGLIGAIKTHVHVHWWSNAVKDLIGKWPLAELSLSVTQGFNSAAQFTAGPMLGREDPEGTRMILLPNAATEGIPVHSNLGEIADNSRAHRMMKACREKLKNEVARHLGALEVEAILQATIMHAIEHHCLSQSMPWRCYSHLLGAELTPFRTTMIRGCTYRTRKLLCRDYKDVDTICGTIYKCCHEIDPEFADTALCVGVAA